MTDTTLIYYARHARQFCEDTQSVDIDALYSRFLPLVPAEGHILDAGCGSGRDALAFRDMGFQVTAFDASPALAALASHHIGQPVPVLRFQDVDWQNRFDAIWACASLLHVPMLELPGVMHRLAVALKPGGILYASLKYGQGEREHEGRRFTDLDEAGLARLLEQVAALEPIDTWVTDDLRPDRESERWLNTLLRKMAAA